MPRAIGDDRITPASDGQVLLFSPESKGWVARRPSTELSSEHPGTAVIWEDEIWEVLEIDEMPEFGVQYRLGPWNERHAIRLPSRYSEETEASRRITKREDRTASLVRLSLWLTAPVSGFLPRHVQERLSRLYGSPRVGLAYVSMIVPIAWGTVSVLAIMASAFVILLSGSSLFTGYLPLLFGVYLFVETLVRFAVVMSEGRPVGSLLGVVPYWIFVKVKGREVEDPSREVVPGTSHLQFSDEDIFSMLEPLLSLLSEPEQAGLEKRFGFNPFRWGKRTALALALLMAAQVIHSADALTRTPKSPGSLLPLLLALALGGEQVYRLVLLTRGQISGSVLAPLVRPFARRLFPPPPGADQGGKG
jgi:hypothetical protein